MTTPIRSRTTPRRGRSAALDQARLADLPPESDDAEATASNAASSIWRGAIEAALAKDDNKPAIALYGRAADRLAPADAMILDRYIQGAHEREAGRNYVANIPVPEHEPSAPLDFFRSLTDLDAAHADATTQNNTDWSDNPSQRATNQHFIDVRFGKQKSGLIQTKANLDQSVTDWLAQASPDGQAQIERPPLAIWAKLNSDEHRRIDGVLR
jgi:hypothetical protein